MIILWKWCLHGLRRSCVLSKLVKLASAESFASQKLNLFFLITQLSAIARKLKKMTDSKIDLSDATLNAKFLEVRGLKSKLTAFKKELKTSSAVKFESAQIDEIIKIAGPYFVSDTEKDEIRLDLFTAFVVELIKKSGATFEKNIMTTKTGKHNILISLDAVEPKDNIVIVYNEFEPKKTKKDERITAAFSEKKILYIKDLPAFIASN